MYNPELLIEVLTQIRHACSLVLQRFEPVRSIEDFTGSPTGMEKLDAICMQLIAIGESLKKVDTITEGGLLPKYTAIDWKKAKGMRDILSHHFQRGSKKNFCPAMEKSSIRPPWLWTKTAMPST